MDMRLETWNIRSFYIADSLRTVASELIKHNLHLVTVNKVKWVNSGS
jgi:hypothetical protein